jgi:hypothetical protein
MLKLIAWTFALYAGMKFAQLLTGAGEGFDRAEVSWSTRLRAGEPRLLIATLSLFALLACYITWWNHRFLEGQYAYATDCYSKMAASHLLPGRPAKFGSYEASQVARGHVAFAEIHGAQLGMRVEDVDRKLDEGRLAYSGYFTRLAHNKARPEIAASLGGLDRCLNGDGSPRGELLNPV